MRDTTRNHTPLNTANAGSGDSTINHQKENNVTETFSTATDEVLTSSGSSCNDDMSNKTDEFQMSATINADVLSDTKEAANDSTRITSKETGGNHDDVYLKYFVRQIRNLCRLRNISYSQLARDSGVSRSYLNDILAEKANPNLKIMAAISDYFSLPLSYMLNAPRKSGLGLDEGQRRYLIAMTENEWLTMQNKRLTRINEEFSKKRGLNSGTDNPIASEIDDKFF